MVLSRRSRRLVMTAVVVTALATGCAGDCVGTDGPPGDEPVYHAHHMTPSWSADELIAYRDEGVEVLSSQGIWILEPESGDALHFLDYGRCPAWAPDSAGLAFSHGAQIHTIAADGSQETRLTSWGENYLPDWSPDGSMIAWERSVGDSRGVWLMAVEGGSALLVLPYGRAPDWNQSGNRLLCDGWIDSVHGIIEYELDEGVATFLATDESGSKSVSAEYSPDNAEIAFSLQRHGYRSEVWVMDAAGGGARQLTWHGGAHPSWSPDGSKVVYTRENTQSDAPEDGVLWVVDVVTGDGYQLTFKPENGSD